VSKGKIAKAQKILEWRNKGVPGYNIAQEMAIIADTIEQQRIWDTQAHAEGPFAILQGLNLKRFLIGSWPKVLQQLVGLSIFSNYATYFFQLAGNSNPFLVTIYLGMVSLIAVGLDAALVDKIGRRRMTLIGFSGACFGVLLMAIIGCFDYKNKSLGSALVFAGVCANFFNTFQSSTSYAYLTEMPEQRFRARATGWGLAWCNCFSLVFSFCVPLMLKKWVVKSAFLFVCTGIP
jgi:MFS family permease